MWTAIDPLGPKVDPNAHFLDVWEFRKVERLLKNPVLMIYMGVMSVLISLAPGSASGRETGITIGGDHV